MRAEKHLRFGSLGIDVLNHHGSQQYISQQGFDILYFLAFINDGKFFSLLYHIL